MYKFFGLCLFIGKQIIENTKKKIATLDNERLAIGLVSIIGLGLLLPSLIIAPGLFESEWFLNFLTVPAEYGSFIADGAYIGRLWNLFTARPYGESKKTIIRTLLEKEVVMNRQIGYAEKLFTPIGICLGISLAIFCIALHATIPFLGVFSYFAYILFTLTYACALGGLFNRLASSFDGTRLIQEKKAILVGVVLGLIFAISLFCISVMTGTMPFVVVAGISKVFVDLLILHKLLFVLPFVLSLTSVITAFFDYFAKAYCFLRYKCGSDDTVLNERLALRNYEYSGAFFGISMGCLLALGITTGLVLTGGLAATPVAITATVIVTIIMCNSVLASLFSRLGRLIDGIKRAYNAPVVRQNHKESLINGYPSLLNTDFTVYLLRKRNLALQNQLEFSSKSNDTDINDNEVGYSGLKRNNSSPAFFCSYEQVNYPGLRCSNSSPAFSI